MKTIAIKTILKEKNNEVLVKIEKNIQVVSKPYTTVRYEWWTDKDKMNEDIESEFINGKQHIYCRGFAGSEEGELIKMFLNDRNNKTQ